MHKLTSISFNGITANDWATASKVAAVFDTVTFKVVWANGETYEGSATPTKAGYDFAKHIRTYCLTYTGKAKPTHLSEEQYKAGLAKVSKDLAATLNRILKNCELIETESKKDDPEEGKVVNLREWRFANMDTSPKVEATKDNEEDWNKDGFFPEAPKDGFFPEAPKDVDNFVAAGYNEAKVFNFKLPQGRA